MVKWLLTCGIIAAILYSTALATVLRVRAEFPTIQAAFDSSHNNDTILVEQGLYVEALYAPPHFVYLLADLDSTGNELPELNPSQLPGSDSLACIAVPENASIVIRNFLLRNDANMFPRYDLPNRWLSGGIRYANNQLIEVKGCVFDSVFAAIRHENLNSSPHISVDACVFVDCPVNCIYCRGKLTLTNSQFSGNLQHAVLCLDSSVIEHCQFTGVAETWLRVYGSEQLVRGCTFGPGECTRNPIFCNSFGANLIESCRFDNIGLEGWLIEISMRHPGIVILDNNEFRDCTLLSGVNAPIGIGHGDFETNEDSVIITNCRLENMQTSSSTTGWAKLFELQNTRGIVSIESNHFINNPPLTAAVIQSDMGSPSSIHKNIFQDNGLAVWNWDEQLDARRNYWGDSTGPYHATLNPNGLGDEIRGDVLFDPWYPDTNLALAPNPQLLIPNSVVLSIFPNPFNSTTRITLRPPRSANVTLKLYNVAGQFVTEIWSGFAYGPCTLTWNAMNLAAGVYYVQAKDNVDHFSSVSKITLLK